MWYMIWPIALVVLSNVFYNITTKQTPASANAFLSLFITYMTAGGLTLVLYLVQRGKETLSVGISHLNWTAFALGICIVGLEFGYIHVYRAGWRVNTAPLVANIALSCALLFVGFLLYKESLTLRQLIGIFVCITGLVLVTG